MSSPEETDRGLTPPRRMPPAPKLPAEGLTWRARQIVDRTHEDGIEIEALLWKRLRADQAIDTMHVAANQREREVVREITEPPDPALSELGQETVAAWSKYQKSLYHQHLAEGLDMSARAVNEVAHGSVTPLSPPPRPRLFGLF